MGPASDMVQAMIEVNVSSATMSGISSSDRPWLWQRQPKGLTCRVGLLLFQGRSPGQDHSGRDSSHRPPPLRPPQPIFSDMYPVPQNAHMFLSLALVSPLKGLKGYGLKWCLCCFRPGQDHSGRGISHQPPHTRPPHPLHPHPIHPHFRHRPSCRSSCWGSYRCRSQPPPWPPPRPWCNRQDLIHTWHGYWRWHWSGPDQHRDPRLLPFKRHARPGGLWEPHRPWDGVGWNWICWAPCQEGRHLCPHRIPARRYRMSPLPSPLSLPLAYR